MLIRDHTSHYARLMGRSGAAGYVANESTFMDGHLDSSTIKSTDHRIDMKNYVCQVFRCENSKFMGSFNQMKIIKVIIKLYLFSITQMESFIFECYYLDNNKKSNLSTPK